MPRTIWSGAISFGLVTVPIHVVGATEDHSIHFHQYHLEDMGRVRYRKVCELEGREVAQDEIGKGYELTKTQVIPITDEDLSNLPLPTAKAIEIDAFVPLASIDPIRIAEGYYLQPAGQVAAKPYKLLVQALGRSSKVAVAKYAWSGRERLGLLRVRDDVLVLHAMRWPDEVRDPAELLPPPVEVTDEEIEGALALMDTMTTDSLEGPEFQDQYTEALAQIIEAKREEKPLPEAPEPEQPAQVLDLMAALNASVQQARASRGERREPAEVHELPSPKRKTTAKKQTAAKRTPTGKTTTAKKTTATTGKTTAAGKQPTTAKKTTPRKPRSA
ncbi:Ku protein [Streptomyces collinus]|uniref:Non-homologous end joining protein Ku n=1 Tax=Streptomyces collinus (strain DSM 40733 / Tue 365) TaxID=1214242 RepID=S5V1F5_STRC3|nr:Ku protein [Streptomyces collinus]AGS71811.1 Ku70/Ku80 protein [Streptomyces collinus Tu 365]UJA10459.1 Ku protein [Streptomyces collinus]UJA14677.1 Ku protein [Streptomyces collinus]